MKIVTVIGARPQFVKAATVSRIIRNFTDIREFIIHTGQHYDENMSQVFFQELYIPAPDINLGIGSGSHAWQTGMMLQGIENTLLKENPDWVLLYGDTNSTIAGALAAAKLHLKVAHVEAGLRSFNRSMPEEINRIVTDRISNLLFAPTKTAMANLEQEGLQDITRFSGDVMFDSILYYKKIVTNEPEKYKIPGIPDNYLLTTIHRAENTDNPIHVQQILEAFSKIHDQVVFPVHPRTRKILSGFKIPHNLLMIEPVSYLQMINLTIGANKVLTDSGGLQKEAYFLGTPCITLRTETEWIETLHDRWNTITGTNTAHILEAIELPLPTTPQLPAFGEGNAAEMIVKLLKLF